MVHFSLFSIAGLVLSGAWQTFFWCNFSAEIVQFLKEVHGA
jgi:hypothetical protein